MPGSKGDDDEEGGGGMPSEYIKQNREEAFQASCSKTQGRLKG